MLIHRSQELELLDLGPEFYSKSELTHCQKMLFRVNWLFGFFHSTRHLIKKFPHAKTLSDVGCGAGLFIIHLKKSFPAIKMMGIDISSEAISLAVENLKKFPHKNICFKKSSAFEFESQDIILSTLMCHHLSDDEIILFLKKSYAAANLAVIINDLHRSYLAQIFYRLLSPILFRNRLITHDGMISIRRSFIYSDWKKYLCAAGISNYKIKWCFPFRWQIILWKK